MTDSHGSFPLSGDELPCDMRIPSDKQDKLHGCLEHLFNQVGLVPAWCGPGSSQPAGSHTHGASCLQVDAINALLKGPVMGRAFEETRHFPMEHSLQGEGAWWEQAGRGHTPLCVALAGPGQQMPAVGRIQPRPAGAQHLVMSFSFTSHL